jgi:hypothetical protein
VWYLAQHKPASSLHHHELDKPLRHLARKKQSYSGILPYRIFRFAQGLTMIVIAGLSINISGSFIDRIDRLSLDRFLRQDIIVPTAPRHAVGGVHVLH